jgi:glycosyltransferase involved in cell wall biosynthesis
MHHVYGLQRHVNGRAYDAVVPNFFDPADFIDPTVFKGAPKADYLLYIGRLVQRKGPHIAAAIAERMGLPLVVAGPGATSWDKGKIVYPEGEFSGDVEYVGVVGFRERAKLMARARAVIVPTLYIEPFGGVAVEAMLSGTPVVASDWGSFTEIVTPDVGMRFRTLRQGVEAVEYVSSLDPGAVRTAAVERFGLEAVGKRFMRWFDTLDTLWATGWYE